MLKMLLLGDGGMDLQLVLQNLRLNQSLERERHRDIQWNISLRTPLKQGHLSNKDTLLSPRTVLVCFATLQYRHHGKYFLFYWC